jgi:hypothetical protein
MRKVLTSGLLLAVAVAFIGCAEPPKQEIDAAQVAVDEAKQGEADVYATDMYQAAKDSLDAANARVAEQEKKWFKNYDTAKSAAIRSKEIASEAVTQAKTNKEAIRNEARALVDKVAAGVVETRTQIESAPRGKGADEDLDQLQGGVTQADQLLTESRSSLDADRPKDALEQAKSAESKLTEVQGAVQAALQKIEERRMARRGGR